MYSFYSSSLILSLIVKFAFGYSITPSNFHKNTETTESFDDIYERAHQSLGKASDEGKFDMSPNIYIGNGRYSKEMYEYGLEKNCNHNKRSFIYIKQRKKGNQGHDPEKSLSTIESVKHFNSLDEDNTYQDTPLVYSGYPNEPILGSKQDTMKILGNKDATHKQRYVYELLKKPLLRPDFKSNTTLNTDVRSLAYIPSFSYIYVTEAYHQALFNKNKNNLLNTAISINKNNKIGSVEEDVDNFIKNTLEEKGAVNRKDNSNINHKAFHIGPENLRKNSHNFEIKNGHYQYQCKCLKT